MHYRVTFLKRNGYLEPPVVDVKVIDGDKIDGTRSLLINGLVNPFDPAEVSHQRLSLPSPSATSMDTRKGI